MAEYDSIISLGGACEVATHIGRCFNRKRRNIFDWWITPFDAVPSLMRGDFSGLFDKLTVHDFAVICNRYKIIHHHDFQRDDKELVIAELVEAQLPKIREKYDGLVRRLHHDCRPGNRVLFVRAWREIIHEGSDYPRHLIRGVPQYDFENFLKAIAFRFPHTDFECLFVNYGEQVSSDGRALFHNIKDFGDAVDWRGSFEGWDEMFRRFEISWR